MILYKKETEKIDLVTMYVMVQMKRPSLTAPRGLATPRRSLSARPTRTMGAPCASTRSGCAMGTPTVSTGQMKTTPL